MTIRPPTTRADSIINGRTCAPSINARYIVQPICAPIAEVRTTYTISGKRNDSAGSRAELLISNFAVIIPT